MGNHTFIQHLDEADMEYHRIQNEIEEANQRRMLEENAGKIANLQADRDHLAQLQGELQEARRLFELYNPTDD